MRLVTRNATGKKMTGQRKKMAAAGRISAIRPRLPNPVYSVLRSE
jgi:hypothetical protein